MNYYSPFNKPIPQVEGKDLAVLRSAYEGWYLDYKVDAIDARGFAKSMSAFANHEGGWLFVGVQEEEVSNPDKGTKQKTKLRKAGSFPGVDTSRCESIITDLRTAASNSYLSPRIVFDAIPIHGPVPEVQLDAGRSVILVHVPASPNPPHIHKDGFVYRRHLDTCDPLPITARTELDEMSRRSQNSEVGLAEFTCPVFPKFDGAGLSGRLAHISFISDPSMRHRGFRLSFEKFAELMSSTPGVRLRNCFTVQDGYFASGVPFESHGTLPPPSVRLWHNGNVRLTIPVYFVSENVLCPTHRAVFDRSFEHARPMYRSDVTRMFLPKMVLDLATWSYFLFLLVKQYCVLRDFASISGSISSKVVFDNVAGLVPFAPLGHYEKQTVKGGIPIIQDQRVFVPAGVGWGSMWELTDSENPNIDQRGFDIAGPLILLAFHSIGISFDHHIELYDGNKHPDYGTLSQMLAEVEAGLPQNKG